MNIKIRYFVTAILFLTFVIVTPLLILYTAGFRYNIKKSIWDKTGSLVLKSKPAGAEILLNNKSIKTKTPARINNVLPDDYEITLSKTSYYSWTKKLSIKSQETTFAEDVILFKKTKPELIAEDQVKWHSFSPNAKYVVYVTSDFGQDYLYLHNLNSAKTRLIFDNNTELIPQNIIWAPDASYFLLTTNTQATLISTALFYPSRDMTAMLLGAENVKWDAIDAGQFYWQKNNAVYRYDTSTAKLDKILNFTKTEKLLDFFALGDEIFTIKQINKKIYLAKAALSAEGKATDAAPSIELKNDSYRFWGLYKNYFGLKDNENDVFYLIDRGLAQIYFHKSSVSSAKLHPEKNLLLLATEQELSFLDISQSSPEEKNITRFSAGLQGANWHSATNYVLYCQDNNLKIIELDDRNGHFTFDLAVKTNEPFEISPSGESIYFISDGRLKRLEIQ